MFFTIFILWKQPTATIIRNPRSYIVFKRFYKLLYLVITFINLLYLIFKYLIRISFNDNQILIISDCLNSSKDFWIKNMLTKCKHEKQIDWKINFKHHLMLNKKIKCNKLDWFRKNLTFLIKIFNVYIYICKSNE